MAAEYEYTPPTPPTTPTDGRGKPREEYKRVYYVVPGTATQARRNEIYLQAAAEGRTVGPSYDDAGIGDLDDRTAVLWDIPTGQRGTFSDWFHLHYPGVLVEFRGDGQAIKLANRPCQTNVITQRFGANPNNYAQFGLPGHEGLDLAVPMGGEYYAAAAGKVAHASDRKWSSDAASAYGWHVVIDHGDFWTIYAHAKGPLPVVKGQTVKAGQVVGYSGNTGNSSGYHLHFGIGSKVDTGNGFPMWSFGQPIDPAPYLEGLSPPPAVPPAQGSPLIGLHASADPGDVFGGSVEVAEFKALAQAAKGKILVKVLSAISERSIRELATAAPGAAWVVRAFLNFGGRLITPEQFFDDTIADVGRAVATLNSLGVKNSSISLELHNEPNLTQEGLGASWANGREFGAWVMKVAGFFRAVFPGLAMIFPGLSPGWEVPGVRAESWQFTQEAAGAIAQLDALGVHAYWSQAFKMDQALTWVRQNVQFAGNKPILITEASRNDRPSVLPAGAYAAEYAGFVNALKVWPSVAGVAFFVASASNDYFWPECWVTGGKSKGIAAAMGGLV